MREFYRNDLESVVNELASMSDSIQIAVRDATRALLNANLQVAERVIGGDLRIDAAHDALEQKAFTILARQAPVAGDLRTLVAVIQMNAALGRMGDLAAHIAKIARMRYPERAVPETLVGNFERMSTVAQDMIGNVGRVLAERNLEEARTLAAQDEEMDNLRTRQFQVILGDDWEFGVEAAVDVALLGRYFERIADHAVAMGRRVIYIITGEFPEGEDWPTT
ncbi:phosphate transport system regulatory protein PhoU [Propionibacterium sp. oral taxon 192 str. F0372]|uniref:phosphate signaling complex protein PhoU n=1 Tax=Propionibacterium sp. oral taxon 192 TaxID=671222 RepID=UPI0003547309|nr:phosphate signaling complex protein PhoU [Propionibacterium sp. oral taxon 192]EPH06757.1 phosphate transport system regulatory protein PhoU [Propionibacterium sp. oral taxon 192 str. F0372]